MKFILAPLAAIGLLAMFASAAADQQKVIKNVQVDATRPEGPMETVFAYWPNKKESDPDTRIIKLQGEDVLAIYRDPKDNKIDLSNEEEVAEGDAEEDFDAADAVGKNVRQSVWLDENGEPLFGLPGRNVPSSLQDAKTFAEVINKVTFAMLDPNTPGIEDVKDPPAAMIQMILNMMAMEGPGALEEAKKDPNTVKLLDSLYEHSRSYEKDVAAFYAKLEAAEKKDAGSKVKRHVQAKGHHHHKKASGHKKKN